VPHQNIYSELEPHKNDAAPQHGFKYFHISFHINITDSLNAEKSQINTMQNSGDHLKLAMS
jgi:hypothetical protein